MNTESHGNTSVTDATVYFGLLLEYNFLILTTRKEEQLSTFNLDTNKSMKKSFVLIWSD